MTQHTKTMSTTSNTAEKAEQHPSEHYMYRPPDQEDQQEVTLDDVMDRIRSGLSGIPGFGGDGKPNNQNGAEKKQRSSRAGLGILVVVVIIGLAVWLGTGIYTVGPEEQAALRTFGRFQAIADQGLHWHWPAPIGTRNVVPVTNTRRMELGFRSSGNGSSVSPVPSESEMITGDENMVDVQAVVQYRISNLRDFLFEVDDPGDPERGVPAGSPEGDTLRDIAETAVRQVVGARNIDDVLTTEKEQVQTDILLKMRELASAYRTGIDVLQVLLQNVNPPADVQDAFEDVVRAREDRERDINLAEAYEASQIPQATGRAAQIVEEADGFKQGRIARARGEADGFIAILQGYEASPDVTRKRLYLEALERILADRAKVVLPSELNALPLLPLDSLGTLSGSSSTSAGSSSTSGSTTVAGQ